MLRSNGNRGVIIGPDNPKREVTIGISVFGHGLTRIRPSFERYGPDYWMWQGFGLTIWHDTTVPMTVGQRGVW